MDTIFERGDYRAFIVIAPKGQIDNALFAFPVFSDQDVPDVFETYKRIHIPADAEITFRGRNLQDPDRLGYVFADAKHKNRSYIISTITIDQELWKTVVPRWEDQWVFDHLVATGQGYPQNTHRHLIGSRRAQDEVKECAAAALSRYSMLAFTLYTAYIFFGH